jgi:hypothetical protein
MLNLIFPVIQARLVEKMPVELLDVDWYLGQYKQTGEGTQLATPAAYLEFQITNCVELPNNITRNEYLLKVHLVDETLSDTGERVTSADVDHYGKVQKIKQALQGFEARVSDHPDFVQFAGTSDDAMLINMIGIAGPPTVDHSLNNFMVTIQSFDFVGYDFSAVPRFKQVIAELTIER